MAIFFKELRLAIEPSSWSKTVESTDTGGSPASLTKSTEASVCPALCKTPPSLYLSGNTCPGLLKSPGLESGDDRARIVFALSAADTPFVVPALTS